MAKDFKVGIQVGADTKNATSGMSKLEKQIGLTNKQMLAMGVAVTAVAGTIAMGMTKAINAASDFQETQSKFDVVFANQKMLAEDFATTLVEAYAMSEREAKANLSAMQDLLVPMGVASDKAALFSNEIVKLSADLGSFNNLPTSQVMIDMQSALVGNFETMKKYGVVLNATRVQQKALEMGLKATKEELTAGDKAIAAYNLILAGSTAAIGDMERTSMSFANQMKFLKASVEDLWVSLGTNLIPIATEVVIKINNIVQAIKEFESENQIIAKSLDMFSNSTKELKQQFELLSTATKFIIADTKAFVGIIKENKSIMDDYAIKGIKNGLISGLNLTIKPISTLINMFDKLTGRMDKATGKTDENSKATVNSYNIAAAAATNSNNLQTGLMDSKLSYLQEKLMEEQGLKNEFAMQDEMNNLFLIDNKKGVMGSYYDWNKEKLAEQAARQKLFTDQVKQLHANMQSSLTTGFATSMKNMIDNGANFANVMTTISNAVRDVFINMMAEVAAEWAMKNGLMAASTLVWKGITLLAIAAVSAGEAVLRVFEWVPFPLNIAVAAAAAAGAYSLVSSFFATGVRGFGGGMAMVGERGPELVNLPSGSNVYNTSETGNMLSRAGSAVSKVINLNVNFSNNSFLGGQEETIDMITDGIMTNLRLQANV